MNNLPTEMFLLILGYATCTPKCIFVCKHWYSILSDDFTWYNSAKMKKLGPYSTISLVGNNNSRLYQLSIKILNKFELNKWELVNKR